MTIMCHLCCCLMNFAHTIKIGTFFEQPCVNSFSPTGFLIYPSRLQIFTQKFVELTSAKNTMSQSVQGIGVILH